MTLLYRKVFQKILSRVGGSNHAGELNRIGDFRESSALLGPFPGVGEVQEAL
jgi:hypothetical protein